MRTVWVATLPRVLAFISMKTLPTSSLDEGVKSSRVTTQAVGRSGLAMENSQPRSAPSAR
jgi:hypothetical protein